jgi:hypothetical protein
VLIEGIDPSRWCIKSVTLIHYGGKPVFQLQLGADVGRYTGELISIALRVGL